MSAIKIVQFTCTAHECESTVQLIHRLRDHNAIIAMYCNNVCVILAVDMITAIKQVLRCEIKPCETFTNSKITLSVSEVVHDCRYAYLSLSLFRGARREIHPEILCPMLSGIWTHERWILKRLEMKLDV